MSGFFYFKLIPTHLRRVKFSLIIHLVMQAPPIKPDDLSSTLLTVADIVRFKADYEADVKLLEELPARIKAKRRKYEASLFFAPHGFDPDAPIPKAPVKTAQVGESLVAAVKAPEPPSFELSAQQMRHEEEEEGEERVTWIGELERVLSSASSGMSHQDALSKLKETSLGERVSKGEKGFYNAVALLEKKGGLIKSGGLLYSSKLVEEMKARGELLPDVSTETRRRAGGSGSVVLEVLRANPGGLDANALRHEMSKLPGVSASIVKHGHYIYNVLGTLMGQAAIEKDAQGVYKIKGGE